MSGLMLGEWQVSSYIAAQHPFNETEFDEKFNTSYSHFPPDQYQRIKKDVRERLVWSPCLLDHNCTQRVNDTCPSDEWERYPLALESSFIIILICVYMIVMSVLFYHLLIAMVIDVHARVRNVFSLCFEERWFSKWK